VADRFHDLQRHRALCEQTQGPVGKPLRRRPEAKGNDFGLLLAVEYLGAEPALGLALECDLEPFRHQAFPQSLNRARSTVERLSNLGVRPVRAIGVGLQQDTRPPHLLSGDASLLQSGKDLPLGIRQPNDILLSHGPILLGWAQHDQNHPARLPEITSVTKH
jgi:hypothetical protein